MNTNPDSLFGNGGIGSTLHSDVARPAAEEKKETQVRVTLTA